MQKINRIIIVGSGASIREHLWDIPITDIPIWKAIENEFTISINWSYKWMNPTILLYSDPRFYCNEYENFKEDQIIVGKENSFYDREYKKKFDKLLPNLKLRMIDSCNLSGEFAIGIALKFEPDEIYILGYDGCETDGRTHFYQGDEEETGIIDWNNRKTTGVGKNEFGCYNTSIYNNKSFEFQYEKFRNVKPKIFNVGEDRRLKTFESISYKEMYERIQKDPNIIQSDDLKQIVEETI